MGLVDIRCPDASRMRVIGIVLILSLGCLSALDFEAGLDVDAQRTAEEVIPETTLAGKPAPKMSANVQEEEGGVCQGKSRRRNKAKKGGKSGEDCQGEKEKGSGEGEEGEGEEGKGSGQGEEGKGVETKREKSQGE